MIICYFKVLPLFLSFSTLSVVQGADVVFLSDNTLYIYVMRGENFQILLIIQMPLI